SKRDWSSDVCSSDLTVDVTKYVSPDILEMAVNAKHAIPSLEVAGVDMIVENLRDPSTVHIVEVNTAASPDLHRYTHYGVMHAVDSDVVQYFHKQYSSSAKYPVIDAKELDSLRWQPLKLTPRVWIMQSMRLEDLRERSR